jgi:hypothetical protein
MVRRKTRLKPNCPGFYDLDVDQCGRRIHPTRERF